MRILSRTLEKAASAWKKVRRPVIAVLILAPIFGTTLLSFQYGLEVPRTDSWDVIPILLQKQSAGELSFSDFWAQHNEQRLFFPRLAMFTLAQASGWNFKVGIGFNLILAAMILVVIWKLLQTTFGEELRVWVPWLLVIFSWITFSTDPWQNLIWEISGTLFFMNVLAAVVALWSLARWPEQWKGTCFAALATTISMYSLGNGLLIWVVGLGMLFFARRLKITHVIFWMASGALATVAYFYHYVKPAHHPGFLYFLEKPLIFLKYVFTLVGAPWHHSVSIEVWLGFAGVLIFLGYTVWAWTKGGAILQKSLPWLAMGWFVLLNAIVTGMSRVNYGVLHAFAPRYVTITNLFWIAFIVFTFVVISYYIKVSENNIKVSKSLYALGTLLAILFTLGYADAYDDGIKILTREGREVSKQNLCVFSGCYSEECGNVLNIGPEKFKDRIELLRRLRMGPFRGSVSIGELNISSEPPKLSIGQIKVVSWRRTGSPVEPTLFMQGWVANQIDKEPVRSVVILSKSALLGQTSVVSNTLETTNDWVEAGSKQSVWQVCLWPPHQRGEAADLRAYAFLDKDNRAIKLQGDFLVPKEQE